MTPEDAVSAYGNASLFKYERTFRLFMRGLLELFCLIWKGWLIAGRQNSVRLRKCFLSYLSCTFCLNNHLTLRLRLMFTLFGFCGLICFAAIGQLLQGRY